MFPRYIAGIITSSTGENMSGNILIIIPRYVPSKVRSYYEFPLGLAYISACLKQNNYKVDVFNLNHYDGIQGID